MSKTCSPPLTKIGIAIIFGLIGAFGSFKLITGEASSAGAVAVTGVALCGLLIIFFADVIDWFDLKNLKVQMRKVEEARKEVEEREKAIAKVAVAMAELADFLAAFQSRFGCERSNRLRQDWLRHRASQLLRDSGVADDRSKEIYRWVDAVEALDTIEDADTHEAAWEKILSDMEQDINSSQQVSAHAALPPSASKP